MEFVLAIGLGINIFTLFQLVRNKSWKVQSNNIAIAIVVLWIARFLFNYLKLQSFAPQYPVLYFIDQYLFFLDGVLLWLYTKSLLNKVRFSFKTALHFLPFLAGVILVFLELLLNSKEELVQVYQSTRQGYSNNNLSISFMTLVYISLFMILSVIYFLKSLKEIRQYNQVLFANFSNLKNLSAFWIITFLRLWMFLFLIPLLFYFVNYLNPVVDLQFSSYVVLALLLLFSFLFNSNIINQNYLPAHIKKEHPDDVPATPKQVSDERFQKLKEVLETEKYYEDENLSLHKLSGYLDMKPVDLTELIKASEYSNFYDLINSYRIEAIKQELVTSNEQIMVIAYNNGFNSKSAFNRIFKNTTGQTPSEYRKSQK